MIWRRIVPISYGAVVAFIRICLVLYVRKFLGIDYARRSSQAGQKPRITLNI